MKALTVADVEHVAFRLAREHLAFDEPIPEFRTRAPGVLEGCVLSPFQTFGGKSLYPSLEEKAAVLFYLMIKDHPFQNGNKRIAVTTLLVFLFLNGSWLHVDLEEFYNFAVWVAMSPADCRQEVVSAIRRFIRRHRVPRGR